MNSDHTQGYHKRYCDRVSFLLSLSPKRVYVRRKKSGLVWGSAFFFLFAPHWGSAECKTWCTHQFLLRCWRNVSPQGPVPSGQWWEVLLVKCWVLANGNLSTTGTLARPRATPLLWLNLLLGPVMYEIIKTEFCYRLRFCTALWYVFASVCCGFFFISSSNNSPEFGREKNSVLLILLLLIQLYHRGVGSALQALNSVFLSHFALQ